jgi:co-chaperonin GroES (HSP10)
MNLRPLGKNVIIQPAALRDVSAGGIVLPLGEKSAAKEGKVLAASRRAAEELGLEPGARVLYPRNVVTVDAGEGRILVSGDEIIAVLG